MKLRHGIVDEGIVYFLQILGGCGEQAGGGDVIDLPRDPRGIIMDEVPGLWLEDFG